MTQGQLMRRVMKPAVLVVAIWPSAWLLVAGFTGGLGVNPVETVTHETGIWTLRLLTITIAMTPLGRLTGWSGAISLRRMLGLFAFFYGFLHFTTYVWLDQYFDVRSMMKDVVNRPFITMGFTAFVSLIPLAATSTAGMMRRLGGRSWRRLHRLVYVSAVCGVMHYLWLVKADIQRPVIYGAIVGALLCYRLVGVFGARAGLSERAAPTRRHAMGRRPDEADQVSRRL